MRRIIELKDNWTFIKNDEAINITLPHTFNNIDGQDGYGNYYRGKVKYEYFLNEKIDLNSEEVFLEFKGVNSSCKVFLNDILITSHDGGYSTFRANITQFLSNNPSHLIMKRWKKEKNING